MEVITELKLRSCSPPSMFGKLQRGQVKGKGGRVYKSGQQPTDWRGGQGAQWDVGAGGVDEEGHLASGAISLSREMGVGLVLLFN